MNHCSLKKKCSWPTSLVSFLHFLKWITIVGWLLTASLTPQKSCAWGFFAHKQINRLAVFTLPPEMIGFYKHYIIYLAENAINPDARRYAVKEEAPRHFLDADVYDQIYGKGRAVYELPRYWKDAVEVFTEDTLMAYGIVPWHIERMKYRLINAFEAGDTKAILRISADLGHYIADANVPLHTTENYNGQLSGQIGIHGFWESRLPELFFEEYDFFVGKASYLKNTQLAAWDAVILAHTALDSVLSFEKILTERFDESKKFTYEERNKITIRTYSRPFSAAYHQMLGGQVERRLRASIKMIGDFWYTCWVEAGKPDLNKLLDKKYDELKDQEFQEEKEQWKNQDIQTRPHEMALTDPNTTPAEHSNLPKSNDRCCQYNSLPNYYKKFILTAENER